jgi:putative transposase-like DNA-binding protein
MSSFRCAKPVNAAQKPEVTKKWKPRKKAKRGKRTKTSTMVYSYGAGPPTTNMELFNDELAAGHRLRNAMVNLKHKRRKRDEKALASLPGAASLTSLEQEIKSKKTLMLERRAEKKALHVKGRSKKVAAPELNKVIKILKSELKTLYKKRKELRVALFQSPAWKQGKESRKLWYNEKKGKLYHASDGYWCTKIRTQMEAELARKGPPPKFKRWTGEGKVVVQLQEDKGLLVEKMSDPNNKWLIITPVVGGVWVPGTHKKVWDPNELVSVISHDKGVPIKKRVPIKKQVTRAEQMRSMHLGSDGRPMRDIGNARVKMRIGSDAENNPLWCDFTIKMHRHLPPGNRIKWAWLQRTSVGSNERWEFQVTLEKFVGPATPDLKRAVDGFVAVDVGWRLNADSTDRDCGFKSKEHEDFVHSTGCRQTGLRVAKWVGSDGSTGEIRLPKRWLCAYYKVHDLGSIRDKNFNQVVDALLRWAKQNNVPEWMKERLHYAHSWRKPPKLIKLYRHWRDNRFPSDKGGYTALRSYYERDQHLYAYESHLRNQVNDSRADLYRTEVAKLSRLFKTVVLEDIDLATLAKHREPEDAHLEKDAARLHRTAACISSLRTFFKERMVVSKVNPAGTSYTCNGCGEASFKGNPALVLTCESCSRTWDRDENAARNILKLGITESPVLAAASS